MFLRMSLCNVRKRGGVQKSMGHKVPLKTGMLICRPVTSQPLIFLQKESANKVLPLPLGRGACETKSKNGRSRPRKLFISRVFCAGRGIETMVSDHGLGRGQTMG